MTTARPCAALWVARALAVALLACGAARAGQSTDRENPTPLTSTELRKDGTGKSAENYYTFVAGPGEVQLTVAARAKQFSTGVRVDLFDADGNAVTNASVIATTTAAQEAKRFQIAKRQTIVMRIAIDENVGQYAVRLGGAVELTRDDAAGAGGARPPTPPQGGGPAPAGPRRGRIRIELTDGSAQEFDLTKVQRITIEP
jgi:hypothetical protein